MLFLITEIVGTVYLIILNIIAEIDTPENSLAMSKDYWTENYETIFVYTGIRTLIQAIGFLYFKQPQYPLEDI